jgi:hypothetical protein
VTRDFGPTRDDVRQAIYTFGSVAHLAEALGVTPAQLEAWRDGKGEMPYELHLRMIEVVASKKKRS